MIENQNFDRKSKFWSKIENLIENRNFDPKSNFWSKIKMFIENRNFDWKLKFSSKIEILVENRNFDRKVEIFEVKILIEKALKLNSVDICLKSVFFIIFKESSNYMKII